MPNIDTTNTKKIIWGLASIFLTACLVFVRMKYATSIGCDVIWVEIILYFLLSFTLANFLSGIFRKPRWGYRLAVIFPFLVALLLAFLTNLDDPELLVFTAGGSFLGSFIASNLNRGWWENNAQPSEEIQTTVLAMHKTHMGDLVNTGLHKRLFDILLASLSLILSLPIWLLIIFLVWWEDPGPVLFVKNAVGRGGLNFKQLKFRSMITNAEGETGPISGYENDDRVLLIGRLIRKTALDELPQLVNILLGDMSYVGPRPQRTVLVSGYLKELPSYATRHRVRPGLAGLAQVADNYDISPGQKLAWDLVYIQRANLWFDLKLALAAFYLVFVLRWRREQSPEEKIRSLLNLKKPDPETGP